MDEIIACLKSMPSNNHGSLVAIAEQHLEKQIQNVERLKKELNDAQDLVIGSAMMLALIKSR